MIDQFNYHSCKEFPHSTLYFDKSKPCCNNAGPKCDCRVIKVCKNRDQGQPLNSKWLDMYQTLADKNDSFVKVFQTNWFDTIEMEKLPILISVKDLIEKKDVRLYKKIQKETILEIMIAMQSTWLDMLEYSKTLSDDEFVLHGDFGVGNIVITQDLKVKLIDPDSINIFNFYNDALYIRKYYWAQLQLMTALQDFFHRQEIESLLKKQKKLLQSINDKTLDV